MKRLLFLSASLSVCLAFAQEPSAAERPEEGAVSPSESAELPEDALVASSPDRGVSFRIGPAWRSKAALTGIWHPDAVRKALAVSTGSFSTRNAVPSATGYADRDYIDGYVHLDKGTTNPETMEYGLTWNWGYDSSSQYNGSTVSFHTGAAGSSSSVSALSAPPVKDERDEDALGVDAQLRLALADALGGSVGLAVGVRRFDTIDADFDRSAAIVRESSSSYSFVDIYDAHWGGFPSAPYANDIDGPGYLLDNQPMARTTQKIGGSSSTWIARSRAKAELDSLDLRLGTTLEWRLASWLGVEVQPQVLAAHVDLSADVETVVMSGRATKMRRIDHEDKDAWLWGAGVEASATAGLGHGWHLAASAAWDAWFDDVTVSAGPYDMKAELGEWTVSLALGKEF